MNNVEGGIKLVNKMLALKDMIQQLSICIKQFYFLFCVLV